MRHSLGPAVASPRRGIVGRLAPTLSDTTEQLRASFVLSRNVARLGLLLGPGPPNVVSIGRSVFKSVGRLESRIVL